MSMTSYSIWSTAVLLGVLVLIPICVWLMKKLSVTGFRAGATLRVVESISIGQRERMVVMHTGEEYLLIGVTSQQMCLIRDLPSYQEQPSKGFGSG